MDNIFTKKTLLLAALFTMLIGFPLSAQNKVKKAVKSGPISPTIIKKAVDFSISKPLRDMEPSKGPRTKAEQKAFEKLKKAHEKKLNADMQYRSYPNASQAKPFGNDPVWQKREGRNPAHNNKTPILNIDGQDSPYSVSDCNGAVGPNHYMQAVNMTYAIWDKNGNQLVAPTNFNTLFEGVEGANRNDGDPIVLYDDQADRWLAAEFSLGSNNFMLVAVSKTNDPTGEWYRWSFDVDEMPDYEKFGIWRDGYYMATNNDGGEDIYVFERDSMLLGKTYPRMIGFSNPNRPESQFHCVEPLDNDGNYAPEGTPGQFITINDDAWGGSADELWIYELVADWETPSNSTFERTQTIPTEAFDSDFGSSWDNISQKDASQKVDAVPQILMFRAQYRNWGSSQTIVCAHTVDVDDSDHAGIRWYELENTGGDWYIRQQGTYAPDEHSRWIPSISMDANHNIALGYNISSSSMFPGIRYCGQSAVENQNASGIMDIAEEIVLDGEESHTSDNRWADYAEMSVDPSDDATFWFTTEYANGGKEKATKIVSFQFQPAVVYDVDAGVNSMISPVSGTDLGETESVEIVVRNYGSEPLINPLVYYQINGGELVSETFETTIDSGEIANYTFSQTADLSEIASYEFKIYTGLTDDENHNNDTIYRTVTHSLPTYCTASGNGSDEYITKVDYGSISNSSSSSQYTDYTNYMTSAGLGVSKEITITIGNGYSSDQCLVWIDFNQDYTFDDTEKVFESETGEGPHTGTITIPNDALLGSTRMRVRLHDTGGWSSPNEEPCGSSG